MDLQSGIIKKESVTMMGEVFKRQRILPNKMYEHINQISVFGSLTISCILTNLHYAKVEFLKTATFQYEIFVCLLIICV